MWNSAMAPQAMVRLDTKTTKVTKRTKRFRAIQAWARAFVVFVVFVSNCRFAASGAVR
jgi:hypothetical protein